MRLIDADALKEVFKEKSTEAVLGADLCKAIIAQIDSKPTVDAEPVRHGYWEPFDEDEYTCSLCGNIFVTMDGEHPLSNEFKFCPFCGAKMDEREEE